MTMQTEWLKSKIFAKGFQDVKTCRNHQLFKDTKRDQWIAGLPAHVSFAAPEDTATFIAIGGGKGGVGKSVVSANVSAKLGSAGLKVLLIDLDIGSANLHTYFGLGLPQKTLADVIIHEHAELKDIIVETPADGVILAPGGRDESWSELVDFGAGAFVQLWDAILNAKQRFGVDFVILDLGAGIHRHTIDFFSAAHLGIVAVLPEPTSIENAYSFLKATLWRIIENAGMQCNQCGAADYIKSILFGDASSSATRNSSYAAKLKFLHKTYPELVNHIFEALSGRQIGFVVNQIRSQKDIDIGQSMGTISGSYFGFSTLPLGYLNYDDAAWKSLRNRRLLVLDFPHSILSRRLNEVTARILGCLGYQ